MGRFGTEGLDSQKVLGVDSFSILSNHRSFRRPDPFSWVSGGFLERRIPGKNGEGNTRKKGRPYAASVTTGAVVRIPVSQ